MKLSQIFLCLFVFSTFFVIGCLKVGGERTELETGQTNDQSRVLRQKEEKNIRSLLSSIHKRFEMAFYVARKDPFAYKLKVDGNVSIDDFVEALERVELDCEKYLGILTNVEKTQSFNKKLTEKVKAMRDFLDNYSFDASYFFAKRPGLNCPKIAGVYKFKKEDKEKTISIKMQGCNRFEVSRSSDKKGPVIDLRLAQDCKKGEGYNLCFRGKKMASNHIEFIFKEKWAEPDCTKENWVRVDEKGGLIVSKVLQKCAGAREKVWQYEDTFLRVGAIN